MSHKNTNTNTGKHQPNNSVTVIGSGTTSTFDRLRYNLSPVSSYYKPLMRTFTRRDNSFNKVSNVKASR